MKLFSLLLVLFLSGFFINSCAMPVYAFQLGPSKAELEQIKMDNLLKKKQSDLISQSVLQGYSKTLNLKLPSHCCPV